jgi:hypothetical protein
VIQEPKTAIKGAAQQFDSITDEMCSIAKDAW